MTSETPSKARRHQRIALPKGMTVAWHGGGDSQVSRVKTLGMGGLFLAAPAVRPVGTTLTLLFEVPGGFVQAQGVVRSIAPGEGMGVEFTDVGPQARVLLDDLLKRLLQ
jgi:PilZ domain-containing protein